MDYLILALALIACAAGVIGMIAAVMELRITRRWLDRRERHERKTD